MPHSIRLRGPWVCTRGADRWIYARRFNRPTGLTPQHRGVLRLPDIDLVARLNEQPVGNGVDIRSQLQATNVLEIELAAPINHPEATLDIHEP